ncbi:MAG: hypothetical protein U9P10_08665 [Thermodesulfobacteriota bacterium]|nr:hypothetical protein [Thermodesulfobacteriota bacterium]
MGQKITWEEMKQQFPDEWLAIINFDVDDSGHLAAGVVERHSPQKNEVYRLPVRQQSTAFRYTGASSFSGLRSHVATPNVI